MQVTTFPVCAGKTEEAMTLHASLLVDCDSRDELDRTFELLGAGGRVLLPPAADGFGTFYAWVEKRYGVPWQLSLPQAR